MAMKESPLLVSPALDRTSNRRSLNRGGSRYVGRSSTRRRRRSVQTIQNMPSALFLIALFVITQWSTPSRAASFVPDYVRITNANKNSNNANTCTQLECQLLGMNCATPTEFALTWPGFCQRGGDTDIHRDGWGRK
jgi:hypothetical protein